MSDTTLATGVDAGLLDKTAWSDLPPAILEKVLAGARLRRVPARGPIYGVGDPDARAGILLDGTARAFLAAADGRQLTVRYARPGAFIGRRSYLLGGHSPVAIHALTDVTMLDLEAAPFLRLVETEVTVARVVLAELGRRLEDVYATVADSAFGTVREKVARHLLALAAAPSPGGSQVAVVTQQELANAVGTMREVAARALRELRDQGIVETTPGRIEILDAAALVGSLGAWQVEAAGFTQDRRRDVEVVLEASPNAVVAVEPFGEILYANALAEEMFGWRRDDLIGRKIESLVPARLRAEHEGHRSTFLADPIPRPIMLRSGLFARRRDGTEFPVWVGLTVVDTRRGDLILASVLDRTGR